MAFQTTAIQDFSGGLDLVSSLNEIPTGYTPNALNWRICSYGGIEKVLGYSAFATLGAAAQELHYFETKDASTKYLVAAEPTAWQSVNSAGTVANIRTAMTSTSETTFVNYGDKCYGLDPFNIMASWDGTTTTTFTTGVSTGPPLGIILGIWSNRMYVAKATANKIGMDIVWSAPADFTSWPAANFVNLGGVGTSDRIIGGVPTADGLVVFTNRTTYVIYDSATGANNVTDSERGCSSRHSLAVIGDTIYGVNPEGVFAMSGRFAQTMISRRVDPLFVAEAPTVTASAGTSWYGSYLASFARQGSTTNNLTLDVFAGSGSIMANQYPSYCWASGQLAGNDFRLYFLDATDRTKIRRAFDGGSFNGTDIACYYDTPPTNLGDERTQKRVRKVRAVGRGDLYVGMFTDYGAALGQTGRLSFPVASGGVWGTFTWDSGLWGGYSLFEGWVRLSARARRFSFRFYESSSSTYATRTIIGVDTPAQLGGCGVYTVEPHFSPTSREIT